MPERPTIKDRIAGGLIGLVTGDALGVPAEFQSREQLRQSPITGTTGHGTHNEPAGTWSDDSSLALATVESLLDGYDVEDIMARFARWWSSGHSAGKLVFPRCRRSGDHQA